MQLQTYILFWVYNVLLIFLTAGFLTAIGLPWVKCYHCIVSLGMAWLTRKGIESLGDNVLPPAVTMNTINISRTAGNAIMAKFCCACGSDISKRVSDRTPLGTAKCSGVLQVWRKMLKKFRREELEQKVSQHMIDTIGLK